MIRFVGKLPYAARPLRGAGAKKGRARKKYLRRLKQRQEARAVVDALYEGLKRRCGIE